MLKRQYSLSWLVAVVLVVVLTSDRATAQPPNQIAKVSFDAKSIHGVIQNKEAHGIVFRIWQRCFLALPYHSIVYAPVATNEFWRRYIDSAGNDVYSYRPPVSFVQVSVGGSSPKRFKHYPLRAKTDRLLDLAVYVPAESFDFKCNGYEEIAKDLDQRDYLQTTEAGTFLFASFAAHTARPQLFEKTNSAAEDAPESILKIREENNHSPSGRSRESVIRYRSYCTNADTQSGWSGSSVLTTKGANTPFVGFYSTLVTSTTANCEYAQIDGNSSVSTDKILRIVPARTIITAVEQSFLPEWTPLSVPKMHVRVPLSETSGIQAMGRTIEKICFRRDIEGNTVTYEFNGNVKTAFEWESRGRPQSDELPFHFNAKLEFELNHTERKYILQRVCGNLPGDPESQCADLRTSHAPLMVSKGWENFLDVNSIELSDRYGNIYRDGRTMGSHEELGFRTSDDHMARFGFSGLNEPIATPNDRSCINQ